MSAIKLCFDRLCKCLRFVYMSCNNCRTCAPAAVTCFPLNTKRNATFIPIFMNGVGPWRTSPAVNHGFPFLFLVWGEYVWLQYGLLQHVRQSKWRRNALFWDNWVTYPRNCLFCTRYWCGDRDSSQEFSSVGTGSSISSNEYASFVFGLDTVQEESEPDFATSVSSLSASSPVEECQLRETVSPMETMSIDTSSASTDSQSFSVYSPSVLANCRSPR